MAIADETNAFRKWSSNPKKWMNDSIYVYYDTIFDATQRAVRRGRRSNVFKESVANVSSKYRYYVPNQWQGTFDQYIEVSQMCSILLCTEIKELNRYLVHSRTMYPHGKDEYQEFLQLRYLLSY